MSNLSASLLSIPLELRYLIYDYSFGERSPHGHRHRLAIASVCRQMRTESLPILLSERSIHNLKQFVTWIARGSPEMLQKITNIVLHSCETSSLQPAVEALEDVFLSDENIPSIIQQIFSKLPDLQHAGLSFTRYSRPPPHPSTGPPNRTRFQEAFLRAIAACCPSVSELCISADLLHVSVLQGFQNLHSLQWSGLSLSTPRETLTILNSLPHLHTMRIIGYSWDRDYMTYGVSMAELKNHVGFTSYVLQNLKPLRHFEIIHMSNEMPSDFLTTEMLRALPAHSDRLTGLTLSSDYLVDDAVVDEVLNIMSTQALTHISVNFSNVSDRYGKIRLEDYVAPSVKVCEISLRGPLMPDGKCNTDLNLEFG